jgi:endonuclease III
MQNSTNKAIQDQKKNSTKSMENLVERMLDPILHFQMEESKLELSSWSFQSLMGLIQWIGFKRRNSSLIMAIQQMLKRYLYQLFICRERRSLGTIGSWILAIPGVGRSL